MKCEMCGKTHDGKYGSGRFCCNKCARSFSSKHVSESGKQRQKEALLNKDNRAKAINTFMKNNGNYEQDSDGRWNRIAPKQPEYKAKKKQNHSVTLGKIGELKTAQKFLQHGYDVFVPLVDVCGTDMIVEKGGNFKKIQVKTSSMTSENNNSTKFSLLSNNFNMKDGQVVSHGRKYKKKDADFFALYSVMDDDVYLIENDEMHSTFTIRNKLSDDNLTTKGKNLEKIHMAEDFQIDKVLDNIDNGIDNKNIIEVSDYEDHSDT